MESVESYGLKAAFKFEVEGRSFASMGTVISQLEGIGKAIKAAEESIKASGIDRDISQISGNFAISASRINNLGQQSVKVGKQLAPLKTELKALKAEARNIDFGDIGDDRAFKSATESVKSYDRALHRLERQITVRCTSTVCICSIQKVNTKV